MATHDQTYTVLPGQAPGPSAMRSRSGEIEARGDREPVWRRRERECGRCQLRVDQLWKLTEEPHDDRRRAARTLGARVDLEYGGIDPGIRLA